MIDKYEMNQPREEKPEAEDYTPSKADEKLIKKVYKRLDEYKAYRAKYDNNWVENYEMYRGKQWQHDRPSYRHSEVINFIFQVIQSDVAILTDTKPKIAYQPMNPNDIAIADIMTKVYDYDWKRNNWGNVLIENLYDSHIYGICYSQVGHEMIGGIGKVTMESKDPFYCFPDPDSYDVNKKSRGFIYAEPIRLSTAKSKYRDKAKYFKPDIVDVLKTDKTTLGKMKFQSPTDRKDQSYEVSDSPKYFDDDKMVLDITYWFKDDDYDEEKKQGEDGKEYYEQRLKYPKGRKVHVVGGVLVENIENGYIDGDERFCPIAKMNNYVLPREFYGISEIEQLKSPQKIFNKLVSFSLDVLTIMGNPIWIVDDTAGIDTDNIVNRPGLIIEKTQGSEVRREEGVQLQPYVLELINRMQTWFNDISGSSDISRGMRPEGVTAAKAIIALQDASHTRLRLKTRLMEGFFQDLAQMYVARVFQFYTAPQVFRITEDPNAMKFFTISFEQGEEGYNVNLIEQESDGNNLKEQKIITYQTAGKFDIDASMGTALPFARAERIELATDLFRQGIVDAEEVLIAADYPNKENVMRRMAERQMQQMQMQQQAQQQQMQMQQQNEIVKAQAKEQAKLQVPQ